MLYRGTKSLLWQAQKRDQSGPENPWPTPAHAQYHSSLPRRRFLLSARLIGFGALRRFKPKSSV